MRLRSHPRAWRSSDGSIPSTASRYGPVGPWASVHGFTGHDQTPKQPEGAMVGVDALTDAVPRDRRRQRVHGGFILQETALVRLRSTRRPAGSPRAASLRRSSEAASRYGVGQCFVTTGAGDAATGSRQRIEHGSYPRFRSGVTGPVRLALAATQWPVSSGRMIAPSTDGTDDPVFDQPRRHSSEGSANRLVCERGGC